MAIRKIRERKSCSNHARPNLQENNRTLVDPLQASASISVTLQRHNAQMIIERQPPLSSLLVSGIAKCHEATTRLKRWAMSKICIKGRGPVSRMTWECPQPPPLPTSPPSPRWGKKPDMRQVNGLTDTTQGECPFSDAEIPPSPVTATRRSSPTPSMKRCPTPKYTGFASNPPHRNHTCQTTTVFDLPTRTPRPIILKTTQGPRAEVPSRNQRKPLHPILYENPHTMPTIGLPQPSEVPELPPIPPGCSTTSVATRLCLCPRHRRTQRRLPMTSR